MAAHKGTFGHGGRSRGGGGWGHRRGTLDEMTRGESFEIVEIPEGESRVTALRFGMAEGSTVECALRIPAGPVILKVGRQEVAVGRGLARTIRVRPCEEA